MTVTPTAISGYCRVTVVAATARVDVALPDDVVLAELLPEILRLLDGPAEPFDDGAWDGEVGFADLAGVSGASGTSALSGTSGLLSSSGLAGAPGLTGASRSVGASGGHGQPVLSSGAGHDGDIRWAGQPGESAHSSRDSHSSRQGHSSRCGDDTGHGQPGDFRDSRQPVPPQGSGLWSPPRGSGQPGDGGWSAQPHDSRASGHPGLSGWSGQPSLTGWSGAPNVAGSSVRPAHSDSHHQSGGFGHPNDPAPLTGLAQPDGPGRDPGRDPGRTERPGAHRQRNRPAAPNSSTSSDPGASPWSSRPNSAASTWSGDPGATPWSSGPNSPASTWSGDPGPRAASGGLSARSSGLAGSITPASSSPGFSGFPHASGLPNVSRRPSVLGRAGWSGHVLTGRDGIILDPARTLAQQGVLHGDLLRLRPIDDLPEAPVHDDVVDAVAEAVLAGGRPWTANALRAAALTAVSLALGLAAVALWFAGSRFPGSFHGRTSTIATAAALFLFAFGIWRARYDGEPGTRGSYYGAPSHAHARRSWNSFAPSPSSSGAHSRRAAPHRAPSHSAAVSSRSSRHSSHTSHTSSHSTSPTSSLSSTRTDGLRDHTVAAVLTTSSVPFAFIAGFGLLPTTTWHGLGRAQFAVGALAVFVLSVASILGLGRRIVGAVAGATLGFIGLTVGIGLLASHASPKSAIAIAACCCVFAIDGLPSLAMYLAGFVVEPPLSVLEPGDFDGYPVNNELVAFRTERAHDTLTGLTAGIGIALVTCVALLVVPSTAMGTASRGSHAVWPQLLGLALAGAALCRTRLFHRRAQVITLLTTTLTTFALVIAAVSAQAAPASRATWLSWSLFAAAGFALPLSTPRRRATTAPTIPPRWSRAIDVAESVLHLAILPILLAVLGVYGQARGLHN